MAKTPRDQAKAIIKKAGRIQYDVLMCAGILQLIAEARTRNVKFGQIIQAINELTAD